MSSRLLFTIAAMAAGIFTHAQSVLYGTTPDGGKHGVGVLFSIDPTTRTYVDRVDFDDVNGAFPSGTLVQADDGKLYGMTSYGGNMREGAIFSYNPLTGVYNNVFNFGGAQGGQPMGNGLLKASNGKLYGLTNGGVNNGINVLFSYDPSKGTYEKLFDFTSRSLSNVGTLAQGQKGKLYGLLSDGIFSFDPVTNTYATL
ncbi:MAG TPA: choice-of-anchor tandem repeat GloVer-containing protein, partial [Niastella sp.]|nr:choice-of-anchor tandem repeat GloVer-containing protein [Niastella sp.]